MTELKKSKAKMGRPIKWNELNCKKFADEMLEYFLDNSEVKTLVAFAAHKQCHSSIFTEVAALNEYFSKALRTVKAICESRIVEHGFEARSPQFAMFMLKCNYSYRDTQDLNIKSDNDITISYDTVTSHDDIDNEDD